MQVNALRGSAGLTGIDIFRFSQLLGRSLQITSGDHYERVFAGPFEDKLFSITPYGFLIFSSILIGAEQANCGYLGTGNSILQEGPAVSIVKTDRICKNRLVDRLCETGDLGAS